MVARTLREEWPSYLPVFVRISAVDWQEGGVTLDASVQLAGWLRDCGIDLVDCSSDAVVPREQIPLRGDADLVFLARALLRDPYWAQSASEQLDSQSRWPVQYARAVT